jgi:hypothetical protein
MLSESLCYAQGRLSSKLAKIDLGSLGISEYKQRYLSSYFRNLDGILQVYGRILLLATEEIHCPFVQFEKPLSRINIYGGATAPIPHM